jgi:hypothetical protein
METSHCQARCASPWPALSLAISVTLGAIGCASPGVPKPPSLNLPQPVSDLTAARVGDRVELRFTIPSRSTDKLALQGAVLTAIFCRETEHQVCVSIPSSKAAITFSTLADLDSMFSWTDTLPEELSSGSPRALGYRVELMNSGGRSAGESAPAFTAAGAAPVAVEGLSAEGSRLGVVLRWTATKGSGEVILRREDMDPVLPKASTHSKLGANPPGVVDLIAPPDTKRPPSAESLLDTSALPGKPYRYVAMRRVTVQLGGRSIELRSAPSASVEFTLRTVYPPLTPTGLTAAAFVSDGFAVDLVWQPVDETGLIAPLAGYNLYREPVDSTGQPTAARSRLNESPLILPGFRDGSAVQNKRYRYLVTAVDVKGNESATDTVLLEK